MAREAFVERSTGRHCMATHYPGTKSQASVSFEDGDMAILGWKRFEEEFQPLRKESNEETSPSAPLGHP